MRKALVMVAIVGSAASGALAQHDHEGDVTIGRNAAGQLMLEFEQPDEPLGRLDIPAFSGWFSDEPGFRSLEDDEPDEDLFTLDPGSFIRVEILGIGSGGFAVLPPDFDVVADDFGGSKLLPGAVFDLGAPDFDNHPFWVVSDADWDGATMSFDFAFRVVDGNGVHGASPSYTSTFFIPAPGALGVAAAGLMIGSRRRR